MPIRKTTEQFIENARKVHKNQYDYSLVKYVNNRVKIKIICSSHGIFEQTPYAHLDGSGCSACYGKLQLTTEQFIEKAQKIHKNKFIYDKTEYVTTRTKICITCPIHGDFWQEPENHLQGYSCLECGFERSRISQVKSLSKFISDGKKIYGESYTYDLVKYVNGNTRITLYCKIHGPFEKIPGNYLRGQGCPRCSCSRGEKEINQILIDINCIFKRQVKFIECKNKRSLPFDFGVYDLNNKLLVLIEYHGRQHYEYVERFGGIDQLKIRQKHDKIKKKFCRNNNIPLLIIPHTKRRNMRNIIYKFLNSNRTKTYNI